ncbi:electron transfer flavoprotein subunit beta [Boudabousia liubingyangii]|uniref:Electron transfer flavoprotein subunit beta n=1 Tax=Boudabousia liubingyangii TaxID=1921764 RepID=A0A1Q5PKR8_9ACTO|nr:electron transfer flavoprotein subunit beta/FixA family protein [Boudabousia liubingyangii]OKL46451.1 electron transfer flavoprotein subunit beta [Boudabousia liubingyangii]OKL47226.1 electron transfer flavoprotein subunit beta [Boudabousia liubingyangii]
MKIAVCVKHVPDVLSERRLEDGRLVRGEDDVLNELDENAIEAAVQIIEEQGSGEVVAFTMGPEDAAEALQRALQMGADRAVHISDERLSGADVFVTAQVLATAILAQEEAGPFDLVITGMASLDGMTSMLPAALSYYLGRPYVGLAREMEVQSDSVICEREADGYRGRYRLPLPAVVSVTDQLNDPRYPNFKAMAAARKKPLEEMDLEELAEAAEDAQIHGTAVSEVLAQLENRKESPQVQNAISADERQQGEVVRAIEGGAKKLAEFIKEASK